MVRDTRPFFFPTPRIDLGCGHAQEADGYLPPITTSDRGGGAVRAAQIFNPDQKRKDLFSPDI